MIRLPPPTKFRSLRQEHRVAQEIGGRLTPASGALRDPRHKGDVSSDEFLVECKTTEKASYAVSIKTLRKIENEALRNNKVPVLQLDIGGESYAVLRWQDAKALINGE